MHHIVFLDRKTFPQHIEIPTVPFSHTWECYESTTPDQVIERLEKATIVITNKVLLTAKVLKQLPKLQFIAITATGVNNVDLDYCQANNILVSNIQGYATTTVPEHVIAMMFALRHNLKGYDQDIQKGKWSAQEQFCFFNHSILDIEQSTIGILGSGSLGKAVAQKAKALGMKVLFAERKGCNDIREGYHAFEDVLKQSDVVTIHCPLTPETTNLIDKTELELMKSSALLINTGRGGIVNEEALVEALKHKTIAAAGVDVVTKEPAPDDNVLIQHSTLPNLMLTPHIAWASDSALERLLTTLVDNIVNFDNGTPINLV